MKLGLGTVQFGLDYGISNSRGRVPSSEVGEILRSATGAGIEVLDTAFLYGESETVLGENLTPKNDFRIVTKTPQFRGQKIGATEAKAVSAAFTDSLKRLGQQSVYGLLVHHADDLLVTGGEALFEAMRSLRDAGLVQKIGVSVYDARQIDAVLERYSIDLVQVPLNVLDQRLIDSGHLIALKERGVEIHARSVFLQGLLLMQQEKLADYFSPYRNHLRAYFGALDKKGWSPLQGALAFLDTVSEVDVAIVGVTSVKELQQIVTARVTSVPDRKFFEPFGVADEGLINPSRWQLT